MRDIITSFKSKKTYLRIALSIIIFYAVAMPLKQFTLIGGVTEIRASNAIPPVLGLVWGPAGVIGTAIGNLICDIQSGSGWYVCLCGFIINFFYAYIPYKLWYSTGRRGENAKPTLDNVGKIIKYIVIILLDSAVVTGMLSTFFETVGFGASRGSYATLFFNNFDFAILLGVPLLILMEKLKTDYYMPKVSDRKPGKAYLLDIPLLTAAVIGFAWFIISTATKSDGNKDVSFFLFAGAVLLTVFCLFKPFCFAHVEQAERNRHVKLTIKSKFIIGYMLVALIFLAIIGVEAFNSHYETSTFVELWNYIYMLIGISINIVFAVAIAFLWYLEKKIVEPIEHLAEAARRFADRPTDGDEIVEPELTRINTGDELTSLSESFNSMMIDITAYMHDLKTVTAEKERIGAELDVATRIQASMLPCIFPAFPDREEFEVYATMNPAKEVGGDFYDFFMVDEDNLAIVAADVSGKGVPAALFMVIGKTLIKDHTTPGKDLGEVFTEVNELLCESNSEELFITAFVGVLNLRSGEFRYVNAGHEMPFISRAGAPFEPYKIRAAFVLAGMEGMRYKSGSLQLEPGDKIFQYTDGVTEATDKDNGLFGMERLQQSLAKVCDKTPEEILAGVKADIDEFVGEAPQFDDITMLCLEYKKRCEG